MKTFMPLVLVSLVSCCLGVTTLAADGFKSRSSMIEVAVNSVRSDNTPDGPQVSVHGFYPVSRLAPDLVAAPSSPLAEPQANSLHIPIMLVSGELPDAGNSQLTNITEGEVAELEPVDAQGLPESLDDDQMANFADLCGRKKSCHSCKSNCHRCEGDQCSKENTCSGDNCGKGNCSSDNCGKNTCGTSCGNENSCSGDSCGASTCQESCCEDICCDEVAEEDFFGASSGGMFGSTGGGGGVSGSTGFITSTGGSGSSGSSGSSGTGTTDTGTDTTSTTGPGPTGPGTVTGPGPGVLVPEPSTWIALGTMASIAAYIKRRRDRMKGRT